MDNLFFGTEVTPISVLQTLISRDFLTYDDVAECIIQLEGVADSSRTAPKKAAPKKAALKRKREEGSKPHDSGSRFLQAINPGNKKGFDQHAFYYMVVEASLSGASFSVFTRSGRITSKSPEGGRSSRLPPTFESFAVACAAMDEKAAALCKKGYHLAIPGVTKPLAVVKKSPKKKVERLEC